MMSRLNSAMDFLGNVIADGAITPGNTEDFIRLHPEHYEGFRKFKYVDERYRDSQRIMNLP
jgi:hypothetical protein